MKTNRCLAPLLASLWLSGCTSPQQPSVGEPLAQLTAEQQAQFQQGRRIFARAFTPEDGLGPLFNANSCAECHEDPVQGGSGDEVEIHTSGLAAPNSCSPLFEQGGPVIQQDATPLLRALGILKEQVPTNATAQAHRSSPAVFGFGLVDAIPDAAILAREDPDDANGDGISGRANRTIDGRVGRFGRKAAVATLFEFNAGAFPQEQGVTTPLSPVEETINGRPVPKETDPAPDPEITVADIERVTDYIRFLAPPPRAVLARYDQQASVKKGEELFRQLNCAACHVPTLTTGPSLIQALDRKPVALYSDLLLHDMGPELADICMGEALPSEFRTEMLMGLRLREQFLHDGSAKTVQESIVRHGGEAQASRDKFKALSDSDRQALLKFLSTL